MRKLLVICMGVAAQAMVWAQQTFEVRDGHFLLDGKPFTIHSGEMHYARVPEPYWSHRFRMMKAMGLNTVATYVFWNYHEVAPGVWDFTSENRNLRKFIKAAQSEGLKVILRPGPYACAEWEFGGFPWWLLKNRELAIRGNGAFVDSCRTYLNRLADEVRDLQITHEGPIIMVQVENEFGSYADQQKSVSAREHQAYYHAVWNLLKEAGFDVPLFTSDGTWLFMHGALPGVLPTANGEGSPEQLRQMVNRYHNGQGPYMVAEYYPGWLDHWGEPFVKIGTSEVVAQVETYLKNDVSFNFYMVHGGTNFGFTSGANFTAQIPIQPQLTSYDYDAPISENGTATPRYMAIRQLMEKYGQAQLPAIPSAIPVIDLGRISLSPSATVFDLANTLEPVVGEKPLTFEDLDQGAGYVLYRKRFTQPLKGVLSVNGLRDYANVFVNGLPVGTLNRMYNQFSLEVDIPFNGMLDILVENLGRINYGDQLPHNRKGIISPVFVDGWEITGGWQMFKLPFAQVPRSVVAGMKPKPRIPTLYSGQFKVKKPGNAFLDMRGWGKGAVFVNGHHLGRYWHVGPQQTLYLPGCWLKKGINDIVVFDQENPVIQQSVSTLTHAILESLYEP
ncbi:MAG: beta-galactosidase [Breznakibacter sp.]